MILLDISSDEPLFFCEQQRLLTDVVLLVWHALVVCRHVLMKHATDIVGVVKTRRLIMRMYSLIIFHVYVRVQLLRNSSIHACEIIQR